MSRNYEAPTLPSEFIWRRIHSLLGLFLALFLLQHLLTNSQAALLIGDDGRGFIYSVNAIHNLPFLIGLEIFLLGVPFAVHMIWGIQYLFTGKSNSGKSDGTTPSLPYRRNKAYSWQRITSWILLLGIIGHVVQMRIWDSPASAKVGSQTYYMTRVSRDDGLRTVAARLGVQIFTRSEISQYQIEPLKDFPSERLYNQNKKERRRFLSALKKRPLGENNVVAVSKNFGTAELLVVRETFKSPLMIALYTIFIFAAAYHAFNGLWTFLITWGVILTAASQRMMLRLSTFLMIGISFLGLASVWMTYWINLKS